MAFPDPAKAPVKAPVAYGGDLSVERLVLAYRMGIYPWAGTPLSWWSPDPRGIIPLGSLHIPRSLARTMRRQPWRYTLNTAFTEVIAGCAAPAPGREDTWIQPHIMEAYIRLHHAGYAHSLEVWQDDQLIGGIYGVAIDGLFSGESMFHRVRDASKAALVMLERHLRERGYALFDTQTVNPLTRFMGAIEIPRREFLERLRQALELKVTFA
jgi:leucyl/phenylalanyl-tRNA--protein transferase